MPPSVVGRGTTVSLWVGVQDQAGVRLSVRQRFEASSKMMKVNSGFVIMSFH